MTVFYLLFIDKNLIRLVYTFGWSLLNTVNRTLLVILFCFRKVRADSSDLVFARATLPR